MEKASTNKIDLQSPHYPESYASRHGLSQLGNDVYKLMRFEETNTSRLCAITFGVLGRDDYLGHALSLSKYIKSRKQNTQ